MYFSDTSPEQQQSVPQIPPDMDQFDEDYFPPPPPDLSELPPPEPANVVHTSPPNAKPNQSKGNKFQVVGVTPPEPVCSVYISPPNTKLNQSNKLQIIGDLP